MSDFQSARHDVGNPTEVALASGDRITFTYNGMDQLTVANAAGMLTSYAFDAGATTRS